MPNRERRLLWANIAQNSDSTQRYWRLQFRKAAVDGENTGKWIDAYCFRADEALMLDFDTFHASLRHSRKAWFMYKVMAFRWLADEEGKPAGWDMIWDNQLRRNMMGNVSLVESFGRDKDRVRALERWFGVRMQPSDVQEIQGTVGWLRPMSNMPKAPAHVPTGDARAIKKGNSHGMMLQAKL